MNLKLFIPFLFFLNSIASAVHPSEIECFGVIGDSISAGFSMISGSPRADFIEYRDQAFAIGRKPDYRTLPNIFHDFYSIWINAHFRAYNAHFNFYYIL